MKLVQDELFCATQGPVFPSTRYQGSKARFLDWLWERVAPLPFHSVLDAFGGTGCFAYRCKQAGKAVTYNDILPFNRLIGRALIENGTETLSEADLDNLLHLPAEHPGFVEKTFRGIYYTNEENRWIDGVSATIRGLRNPYKQALAYFALFQACLSKRPYNLFHRKNLELRLRPVARTFGNKTTWDTPFEALFRRFAEEANRAVFDNGTDCRALCQDAATLDPVYDLVYLDPPYLNAKGVGVDYAAFYHFLDGLTDYDHWATQIDWDSKHLKLRTEKSAWGNKATILPAFAALFRRFRNAIVVLSYRSNGIPSIDALADALARTHRTVTVHESAPMRYTLSSVQSAETLLIALP